jgi:hypothetical protein
LCPYLVQERGTIRVGEAEIADENVHAPCIEERLGLLYSASEGDVRAVHLEDRHDDDTEFAMATLFTEESAPTHAASDEPGQSDDRSVGRHSVPGGSVAAGDRQA